MSLVRSLACVALVAGAAGSLSAQDPGRPPADTLADSLRARHDTSATDRLLQAQQQEKVQLQPLPLVGTRALKPRGALKVFTRDSIDWAPALTVGDLLALVPGVYLWRGGWLGRPELPNYQGRGAASVEYTFDGVPWLPAGDDSLGVDPSSWSLSLLDRVEVEQGPGLLRVALFSRRHDLLAPRTRIGVSAGDRGTARYTADFERRYTSGIGLSLAADYFGVNAPQGGSGAANATNGWIQFGWAPSTRFGLQAQALIQALDRDPLLAGAATEDAPADTIAPRVKGTRTDLQLRGSWQQRDDGLGARADLFVAKTSWTSDSLAQSIGHVGGVAGYRRPTWSAQLTAWHHTEWTPLDARLALGWNPYRLVSGSVEAVEQRYAGDRRGAWLEGRIGFALPFGVRVAAAVRDGHRLDTPQLADATVRRFTDVEASAGIDWWRLSLDAGYRRNDGWQPVAFRQFLRVPSLAPMERTEWATAQARFAPLGWLTLATHYEHPLQGAMPDGTPPHHAYSTVTIRSRFLRNFPSGIFGLKVQGVVESWSPGVIGRDTAGVAIPLPGATFVRGIVQFQIGPFIAFYDRVNFKATKVGYVPGYPVMGLGSTFGVRWEFLH